MEPAIATLPELNALWFHDKATPMRRPWHRRTLWIALSELGYPVLKFITRSELIRLSARPCPDLTSVGPCREILVGEDLGKSLRHTCDDDLSLHHIPREEERDSEIVGDSPCLSGVVVGEERKAGLSEVLEQDGSCGEVAGGKDHGVWFNDMRVRSCLIKPLTKECERIAREIVIDEADISVASTHLT